MEPVLEKVSDYCFRIPKTGAMRVPGIVYATREMIRDLVEEGALKQVENVACLPGIVRASLAMPDIHWGYGFPIGGVAAFDEAEGGIISPGGVGYDINCGVRLVTTGLSRQDLAPHMQRLVDELFSAVPSGVGSTGYVKLNAKEARKVLKEGSRWALDQGMGDAGDLDRTEEGGCMAGADPDAVSDRALERGLKQLGTLGSGNHFLEVGMVDEIYDPEAADVFRLFPGQVTVMIHTGSRGLGYQVCDDYLAKMTRQSCQLGFELPDRQLACTPIGGDLGKNYFAAMCCAANYAWANRQILLHHTRQAFETVLSMGPRDLSMRLLWDVCHNVAKREIHEVDGKKRLLTVHRKGATRSLGPGRADLPPEFKKTGQPVLVPGDMGRASFVMKGTARAEQESFSSACHGAGRVMSRHAAKKAARGRDIARELLDKGILVRYTGRATLVEEIPEAYKDVSTVVEAVAGAGLAEKVARIRPLAVVKG